MEENLMNKYVSFLHEIFIEVNGKGIEQKKVFSELRGKIRMEKNISDGLSDYEGYSLTKSVLDYAKREGIITKDHNTYLGDCEEVKFVTKGIKEDLINKYFSFLNDIFIGVNGTGMGQRKVFSKLRGKIRMEKGISGGLLDNESYYLTKSVLDYAIDKKIIAKDDNFYLGHTYGSTQRLIDLIKTTQ